MIRVAVLGATGSIGRAALQVVSRHQDRFRVVALAAHRSAPDLAEQARRIRPEVVVVAEEGVGAEAAELFEGVDLGVGREALLALTRRDDVDVVLNAVVGAAGLEPSLSALEAGKRLALANKESLVAGGPLVLEAAARGGGELIPIDSEHSAILQCLDGARADSVARLVLTASGGPFRGWDSDDLAHVSPTEALCHPTWDMGAKITIDSATLANKALEVIEAHFLYDMAYEHIDVVVHPQSVVHSFVEFVDGSVLAQVGNPTMELPILYALSYPERVVDPTLRSYDPVRASPLTFESVDRDAFPLFGLGVAAGRSGGLAPAEFNAGNEVAVQAFLDHEIGFGDMEAVVRAALSGASGVAASVQDIIEADSRARARAAQAVARRAKREGTV